MKKKLFLSVVALLIAISMVTAQAITEVKHEPEVKVVDIQILFTSDIHGAIVDSKYSGGDAATISGTGLSRLATVLKAKQAENPNTITMDNGDTIQGTPLTYYYAFYNQSVTDPVIKALSLLGYDAWNLGNHEFNYGMDILNRQILDATANGIEVISANLVKTGTKYDPYVSAYIIRDFQGVKVGLIGMDTPNIPTWDKPANWEGIDFKTFIDCWNHYADILRRQEGCDVVVVACHSGLGTSNGALVQASDIKGYNGEGLYYEGSYENQIAALIENTTGIDLVLGGHTHETSTYTVPNRDGVEIPVIHCGTKASTLGSAVITYDREAGEVTGIVLENIDVKKTDADESFLSGMKDYEAEVWDNYLDKTIGVASADFMGPGNMTEANAFLDLVNKVQLEAIPNEVGAQMSLSAPLNSNSGAVIPAGDIKLGLMFQLYRYENWLYCIDMTGSEIKAWLEFAATKYTVEDGKITNGGGTYCDTLYGPGVSYEIFMGNEEGDRVRGIKYQGKDLDMAEHYKVVINNYRFTGGGYYMDNVAKYLGAPSFAGDESRVYYSTQYDMDQGEDLGQVRNLLSAYIEKSGTISPDVTGSFMVHAGKSEN